MTSTFPLLALPINAAKKVFEHVEIIELIILSTRSTRTKHLVKSVKLPVPRIEFNAHLGCTIALSPRGDILFGLSEPEIDSLVPSTLRIRLNFSDAPSYFRKPGFFVREWLEHFMCIFNQPLVEARFGLSQFSRYTLEEACKLLGGLTIGRLSMYENAGEIIKRFPVMDTLHVNKSDLEPDLSEDFIKKILIGNIRSVELMRAIPLDLNTLLMMNTIDVISNQSLLTNKELNTFLKLWLKGSNPNLQKLHLRYLGLHHRTFDKNVILKGIKHEEVNEEDFVLMNTGPIHYIKKRDGTLAQVYFDFPRFYLRTRP
ncbi:unnamed protein product [Caenorhabditis brenneri]